MMQNLNQSGIAVSKVGGVSMQLNSNGNTLYVSNNGQPTAMPDNFIFEQVDPSLDDENDDSDSDASGFNQVNQGQSFQQSVSSTGLKPGKKTKGRVKIKMEFIQNKLRRYTTFSKRKTGIMKKAYELSTLTGTQVMLLVASETGHVYTFATRKLQPMITSDSGKALIQTCLNSPDPPPGTGSGNQLEQRMKPTGFEETELTCVTGEDDISKAPDSGVTMKPVFPEPVKVSQAFPEQTTVSLTSREVENVLPSSTTITSLHPGQTAGTFTIQAHVATSQPSCKDETVTVLSKPTLQTNNISTNVTNGTNSTGASTGTPSFQTMFPLIFPQGTISMLQPSSQSGSHQNQTNTQTVTIASQAQTSVTPAALSQVVSAINSYVANSSQNGQTGELNTPLPVSTPSINIMQGMTPGIVMYHTPQGVVYATPTQNLHDRTIFNFQQPATAISMTQADQSTGHQQQQQPIIIPVPGTPLLLAPPPSVESNASSSSESAQIQQPPLKKPKK